MNILGIDVGGTSIKGSIVSEKGEMNEKFVYLINMNENQEECIQSLFKVIDEYLSKQQVKIDGIGIGIPGTVDTKKGMVTYSNNLKWKDLKIVEFFEKHYKLPVKITNDANAAALGEAKFGAGKSYHDIVMITLGTGVGGGIVINDQLFEGNEGKGAELGHTTLVLDGLPCSCGRNGCFEQYASATALIRQTKEAIEQNPKSILANMCTDESMIAKTVFEAARKDCPVANAVINQYIHYLSEGLLNICNVFRPQAIVLSGGISKEGKYLTDKIDQYLAKFDYGYPYSPKVEILISQLGYNSGIIGAASLLISQK